MSNPAKLPAPCRVQIGKTVYNATAQAWEGSAEYPAPGPYFWELVATKGCKQPKNLFPDFRGNYEPQTFTLYSAQTGSRRVGLPKLVKATIFNGPQA
jgi:hypothetical protein